MSAQGNGYMLLLTCGCWRNLSRFYPDTEGAWFCTDHGWKVAA